MRFLIVFITTITLLLSLPTLKSYAFGNICLDVGIFQDTTIKKRTDTSTKKTPEPKIHIFGKDTAFYPKKAIIRSAIIPGWGQVYNKKVWKVPIIYGALGTTAYLYFWNKKQYNESRTAFRLATDGDPSNDNQIVQPYYSVRLVPDRIKNYRNGVRQNMDYCVLFFILFWGLNVADAAVDAHLKSFDVSDNLSFRIKIGSSDIAQTSGVSFSLSFK